MKTFCYKVFGVVIESTLECPELRENNGEAEVFIHFGKTPTDGDGIVIKIDDVANFWIRNGQEIIIDRGPESDEDSIRLYLLGLAMGALLRQRGVILLHAATVVKDGKAVAFSAPSGGGKSTLVANLLLNQDFLFVTDEITALEISQDGLCYVHRGTIKLMIESHFFDHFSQFNIKSSCLRPTHPGASKLFWHIPDDRFVKSDKVSLSSLNLLEPPMERGPHLHPLKGIEKYTALQQSIFRPNIACSNDMQSMHFEQLAVIARQINVCKFYPPRLF